VRDNGIGIPPQDHQRIFTVFQRLHHQEPYPKPGVGLAICKRIIERHSGKIWVDSAPGQGATFFFTLPAAEGSSPSTRDG
jgi:signal transduction histidine kinase